MANNKTNPMRVSIALVSNERYRPGLEVVKSSMINASRNADRLFFYEYSDVDMAPFLERVPLNTYNGSKLPYLRLFFPELLPELDWVIYSDVDTIWDLDPEELWSLRDDTKAICWVKDFETTAYEFNTWLQSVGGSDCVDVKNYACSGVCLINLKKWREDRITEKCLDFLRKYGCPPYADQDVLNAVLKDDTKLLPSKWDRMIPSFLERKCVYHITGIGRHFCDDSYRGLAPQYALWFKRANRPFKIHSRWRMLASVRILLVPIVLLLSKIRWPFKIKILLTRILRQSLFSSVLCKEIDRTEFARCI